jgi:hypothetical protein
MAREINAIQYRSKMERDEVLLPMCFWRVATRGCPTILPIFGDPDRRPATTRAITVPGVLTGAVEIGRLGQNCRGGNDLVQARVKAGK